MSCCLWPTTRSTCGGSTAGSFGSLGGLSLCPRCWLCWSAYGLQLGGQVKDGLLAGITLMATPPGVLVPILNDADQTETPFGRLILAAGSLAELAPLVLLSVFFSASSTNPPVELGLRAGFVGLTAVVVGNPADQGMGSVARGTAAAGGHQLPAAVRLAITIALAFSVAAEHFGSAATAVSPVTPARYRLLFLALARPLRAPDWWSTGVRLAQETRYAPVGNRVMSAPVSARASWAARRPPAGHRLGLLQLFFERGQQPFDHRGELVDVGGEPVDAGQHRGEQGGVLGSEELRAFQRLFQLGDLAASRCGPAAPGTLGLCWPAIRWSTMSWPVTPCRSVTTLTA